MVTVKRRHCAGKKFAVTGWMTRSNNEDYKSKNEWNGINGMIFWIVNVKYYNKTSSLIGIQITNKIKVKTITINDHKNMTDWRKNESYLHMKFDV